MSKKMKSRAEYQKMISENEKARDEAEEEEGPLTEGIRAMKQYTGVEETYSDGNEMNLKNHIDRYNCVSLFLNFN